MIYSSQAEVKLDAVAWLSNNYCYKNKRKAEDDMTYNEGKEYGGSWLAS